MGDELKTKGKRKERVGVGVVTDHGLVVSSQFNLASKLY